MQTMKEKDTKKIVLLIFLDAQGMNPQEALSINKAISFLPQEY